MINFKRQISVAIAVSLLSACAQFRIDDDLSGDIPSIGEISILENTVQMPFGAAPLASYRRFYTLDDNVPSNMIVGIYLRSSNPGVSIVARDAYPSVSDGGCGVVHIRYSRVEKKIKIAICAGVA